MPRAMEQEVPVPKRVLIAKLSAMVPKRLGCGFVFPCMCCLTPVTLLKPAMCCLLWVLCEQVNNSLKELNLGNNSIGDQGAASLGEGLKVRMHFVCVLGCFGLYM